MLGPWVAKQKELSSLRTGDTLNGKRLFSDWKKKIQKQVTPEFPFLEVFHVLKWFDLQLIVPSAWSTMLGGGAGSFWLSEDQTT